MVGAIEAVPSVHGRVKRDVKEVKINPVVGVWGERSMRSREIRTREKRLIFAIVHFDLVGLTEPRACRGRDGQTLGRAASEKVKRGSE